MKVGVHVSPAAANTAAVELFCGWLGHSEVRNLMLAAGQTPLELYRDVARRRLPLAHLNVFVLDEYVGVPADDTRTCSNVIRASVIGPWGVPESQFFSLSSAEDEALAGIRAHERRVEEAGGIDVVVLGLGQNGHLGFNEPGSAEDSVGRMIELDPISIEANRKWFAGDYAPSRGVTVGLKTILSARRVLIMAYGSHKRTAVKAMVEGARMKDCPASFLQEHTDVNVYLDELAAATLENRRHQ